MQHAAIWHWYLLLCIYIIFLKKLLLLSIPSFFFNTFLESGIDKSMESSTIPVCPSLMCFFNRDDTEGTNSLKILCDVCVCFVLCKFESGLILWFMDNLLFDDLHAE